MTSKNQKRGRPSEFTDRELELARFVAGEPKSARQLQTIAYRQRAIRALMDDAQYLWLVDGPGCERGEQSWKPAILSELGRIGDRATMRAVALRLCELKPTNAQAIAMIRRWRGVQESPGTIDGLLEAVETAINAYCAKHPGLTDSAITTALNNLEIISETQEDEAA